MISKKRRVQGMALLFVWISCAAMSNAPVQSSAEELFESALYKKDAQGDLEGAIALFQRILKEYPDNRNIAARALLRLGMCYEKLGLEKAEKAYRDVVDQYPEQTEIVRMARERIGLLQQALKSPMSSSRSFSERQVWAGRGVDNSGQISPDGKYLSMVDWTTGDLAVHDISPGGKTRNITQSGSWKTDALEFAMSSVWSPDGKQLAYNWEKDGTKQIELYVVGLDGSPPRFLMGMDFANNWLTPVDWSPDGKNILMFRLENRNCQMGMISVENGAFKPLVAFETPDSIIWNAAFSPDGRFIVFDHPQNNAGGASDISIMTLESGQVKPLITHPADDRLMGWAPDGHWILFKSDRTGTRDAWLIPVSEGIPEGKPGLLKRGIGLTIPLGFSADGSFFYSTAGGMGDVFTARIDPESGRILENPRKEPLPYEGLNSFPEWSPGGKYLAYLSMRGVGNRGRALCLYNEDTGAVQDLRLRETFLRFSYPHWYPDGQSLLVYGETIRGEKGLFAINTQTRENTLLLQFAPGESPATIWSPFFSYDKKYLYYIHEKAVDGKFHIIKRNMQTDEETVLLNTPAHDNNMLSLSPDGKHLALILREEKDMRMLKIMSVEGEDLHELHRFALDGRNIVPMDWSPDGRFIYFGKRIEKGWELWRISAAGGPAQNLGLKMNGFIGLNCHPDGKRITFTSRVGEDMPVEIWVIENFLAKK